MARKLCHYTAAETVLAKNLFAEARANGTLKPGRGLIAIATSNGFRRSVAQATTFRDYLPDARKQRTQATGALIGGPSDTPVDLC